MKTVTEKEYEEFLATITKHESHTDHCFAGYWITIFYNNVFVAEKIVNTKDNNHIYRIKK